MIKPFGELQQACHCDYSACSTCDNELSVRYLLLQVWMNCCTVSTQQESVGWWLSTAYYHLYFHTMQHSYYNIDIISYSRFRYCNYIIFLNEVNISNDIWFFVIQYCLLLIFISALLQFSEVGFLSSVLDFPVTLDG